MATKAVKVDLDKETFLDDLNPVTPKFGKVEPDSPKEELDTKSKKGVNPPDTRTEYEKVFLAPAGGGKKAWRLYVTETHYDMLNTIVKRLSTEAQPQTLVGYLWNVLEDHFKTHGKTIAALIDKTVQINPFDEFR